MDNADTLSHMASAESMGTVETQIGHAATGSARMNAGTLSALTTASATEENVASDSSHDCHHPLFIITIYISYLTPSLF